jgi:hypothetical protein
MMSSDTALSAQARIAELEKLVRALEQEKRSLETQLENLRAGLIPSLLLTSEERAMLQFCAQKAGEVKALELMEHLHVSELRAHFLAENLLRRNALEKQIAPDDGEPIYVLSAFGAKIVETWSGSEKSA